MNDSRARNCWLLFWGMFSPILAMIWILAYESIVYRPSVSSVRLREISEEQLYDKLKNRWPDWRISPAVKRGPAVTIAMKLRKKRSLWTESLLLSVMIADDDSRNAIGIRLEGASGYLQWGKSDQSEQEELLREIVDELEGNVVVHEIWD